MKNNKNKIKWIILIGILAILAIVLIFININSTDTSQEELSFECDKSISLEDKVKNEQKMKLYKKDNDLKLVQSISMHYSNSQSDEQLALAFVMIEQNMKIRINNKFGEDSNDVEFVSKRENEVFYFDIIYKINERNSENIEALFEFDFYNNDIKKIIEYFEEDGFVCKKY